jgi:phosphate starvation-inducible PhoH-like protein
MKFPVVPLLRMTPNHQHYVSVLRDPVKSLVVCTGPAGSGKTAFACRVGMEMLREKHYKQIIITKPLIPVGDDLGYLPGNIRSKMGPWIESYMDLFREHYSINQLEDMMKKEVIKIAPLAYCRGNTYADSFVICDESQNTTPSQLKMLLTRAGERSKMVIVGDTQQQDSVGPSGLADFLARYEGLAYEEIEHALLTEDDVCRSSLVKYLLKNVYA